MSAVFDEAIIPKENGGSTTLTVAKTISSVITYPLYSSLIRKGLFATALYYGGGLLVSTVGLTPVLTIGVVVWLL